MHSGETNTSHSVRMAGCANPIPARLTSGVVSRSSYEKTFFLAFAGPGASAKARSHLPLPRPTLGCPGPRTANRDVVQGREGKGGGGRGVARRCERRERIVTIPVLLVRLDMLFHYCSMSVSVMSSANTWIRVSLNDSLVQEW